MTPLYPESREMRIGRRKELRKHANQPALSDTPTCLPPATIYRESALFQPRYDSIAFAPGRSEDHIDRLARIARAGTPLDPVKVIAFGQRWYLVDGHHRMAAYEAAGWTKPIPVTPRHSELTGDARISWAIQESVVDNKKNRLAMNDADRCDAAWFAVARGDGLSIKELSDLYGVGTSTVSNMRRTWRELQERDGSVTIADAASTWNWRRAKRRLQELLGTDREFDDEDVFDAVRRRKLAKRLKNVMDMNPSPRLLFETIEMYEPGLVTSMVIYHEERQKELEAGI